MEMERTPSPSPTNRQLEISEKTFWLFDTLVHAKFSCESFLLIFSIKKTFIVPLKNVFIWLVMTHYFLAIKVYVFSVKFKFDQLKQYPSLHLRHCY